MIDRAELIISMQKGVNKLFYDVFEALDKADRA